MPGRRAVALRTSCLTVGLAALVLVSSIVPALAGGNTEFRNPANLSEIITRTWDDRMLPLTWVLSETGLPGSGIDNATLTTELTAAFDTWEALTTSKLDYTFGGEIPIQTTGLDGPLAPGIDGVNLVTFTDPDVFFPPGVLAVALTFSFSTDTVIDATNSDLDGDSVADIPEGTYLAGAIFDGDIAFNSSEPWSTSGANGTIDIQAVALHEIGHSFGLCHSSVRGTVMFPFLNNDVAAARIPSLDDVAYASFFYADEPAYSVAFGAIRGQVINGFSSAPLLGAHVYAVDPSTGQSTVGAFTGDDGSYVIPGLAPGNYLVAIEPLDGDPIGLDPARINGVVQFTFDTNFPEEFHDSNESNIETDPLAALQVAVAAGADTTAIDLVTNTVQVPGVNVVLESGYNLFSYPVQVPAGLGAFDLLQAIGDDTEVNAIDRFVSTTGSFERASWVDGLPAGVDFPIRRGEGYVVYMNAQKVVLFSGDTDCPQLDLFRGMNLVGIACPPAAYTSYRLLQDIGARFEIGSIENFDTAAGSFLSTTYDLSDQPIGDDFSIANGAGYVVRMLADKGGLTVPPPGSNFPPVITGLTPGEGVPGTIVLVLGEGFDSNPSGNTVTFNGIGASVVFATSTTLTTTVPASATTGPLRVAVNGQQSNAVDFTVQSPFTSEIVGADTPLTSGQTADGTLALDGEQDRYTFTALAGSLVTASATSVSPGVPDLVLLIEDPFGNVVASDDNGGGGTDPRINNHVLATTGTHTVVVSNLPGSGTGAYQVTLNVTNRSAPPGVTAIGGNFQTGLTGSTLPEPLSVLVTGATGAPMAGVPVSFVATDPTFGGMSSPASAGTTIVSTNSSGIVTVNTTLPSGSGEYTITVTVPGTPGSATFNVAATDTAVSDVQISGDRQSGTVNQELASPLEVVLRDNLGALVGDALVAFQVISGGGTLGGTACTGPGATVCSMKTSDIDGKASVTYTLGKKIDEAQLVAAFVPGQAAPILIEGLPEADAPDSLHSDNTNFTDMTLGTARLNAIQVQVFDQFNNPVAGELVTYTPSGGLSVDPGLGLNGQFYTNFLTDAEGRHVAMIGASAGVVEPTTDEFEVPIPGPSNYGVTVSVGGHSANYVVAVNMGPDMITWSGQNVSHIYGQPLPSAVEKRVLRWERVDTFIDVDEDGFDDDDNGDFRDEDFDTLTQKGVPAVAIEIESRREDGKDEAASGLTPITLSGTLMITDPAGIGSLNVTNLGDVGGVKLVVGSIDSIFVEWFYEDGSSLATKVFTDDKNFAESTNLVAIPVVITTDITDNESGVDLATVDMLLNNLTFFDGVSPPLVLPTFPEKLEVIVGGTSLGGLDASLVSNSAFKTVQIVYYPTANKLNGSNTVEVRQVKDKATNEQAAIETSNFSYP